MKLRTKLFFWGFALLYYLSCSSSPTEPQPETIMEDDPIEVPANPVENDSLKILSLGDSYTIGESVCDTCRFPEQLKDSLIDRVENLKVDLRVIATTGWTTTNLKETLNNGQVDTDYDLVTLLIGVNNQYQGKPFETFEKEFEELVNMAIKYAGNEKKRLIVVSIPDYAFTPFGNASLSISEGINRYNNFSQAYCDQYEITYIFITDITREGLAKPELVASDGLHPSTLAYSRFVSRILPEALEKIGAVTD